MKELCSKCNEVPRIDYRYCESCGIAAKEASSKKRIASLKANKQKKESGINPKFLSRNYKG